MEAIVRQTNADLTEMQAELCQSQDEVRRLTDELHVSSKQLEAALQEIRTLQQEHTITKTSLQEAQLQVQEATLQHAQQVLQQTEAASKREIEKMAKQESEYQKLKVKMQDEVSELRGNLVGALQKLADKDAEYQMLKMVMQEAELRAAKQANTLTILFSSCLNSTDLSCQNFTGRNCATRYRRCTQGKKQAVEGMCVS